MVIATDVDLVAPGVFIWHAYDPGSKTELFSSAFESDSGMYLVDPIPLAEASLDEVTSGRQVAGVIVTNENHQRASTQFAQHFGTDVWMRNENSAASPKIDNRIQVIAIEGAAAGEIALCHNRTLIVGDGLINFEPYGFAFLPAKYCTDSQRMRQSLRQLLDLEFDRVLFAHGLPITSRAHDRFMQLLAP